MKNFIKIAYILLALVFIAGCANIQQNSVKEPVYFTVLHTNDHHGRFWHNRREEYGLAARKTLVDSIRQEVEQNGGYVLLLSGGDINTGVPESDLQDAEPDFKGMNFLAYDAMALGNHEFDNSLEVLRKQQSWADFPFLSANIYDRSANVLLFDAHTILNVGGLKVGVIGFTTKDTYITGNPEYLENVLVSDPIEEGKVRVPDLAQQTDVVIAVTHMGHYTDANHGINSPGDVTLAREVDGLDMIVGGHSQEPVCMESANILNESYSAGESCVPDVQNGTIIMQAYEWGKYVGRADFVYNNGQLKLQKYELIPVNLKKKIEVDGEKQYVHIDKEITPDTELLAFLQPYQEKGQEELSVKIATSNGRLEGDRNIVRFQPTNLGVLVASAQMKEVRADLAVMNSGGIRDSIEGGDITYKDVLKVQPFANTVGVAEFNGKQLKEYLLTAISKPVDSGAFAQFAGVQLVFANGELASAVVNGRGEVKDTETYKIAVNSFLASGGDGYPKISDKDYYVDTGLVDAGVLRNFLANLNNVDVGEFNPEQSIVRK